MQLQRFEVENYRSIKSGEFSSGEVTILIGKNNSGKSNVLEAIKEYGKITKNNVNKLSTWFSNRVRNRDQSQTVNFDVELSLSVEEQIYIINWINNAYPIELSLDCTKDKFENLKHRISIGENGKRYEELSIDFNDTWLTVFKRTKDEIKEIDYGALFEGIPQIPSSGGEFEHPDGYQSRRSVSNSAVYGLEPYSSLFREFGDSIEYIGAIRRPKDSSSIKVDNKLRSDATNLTTVLHTISQNKKGVFNEVVEKYTNIMENIEDIRTPIEEAATQPSTTIEIDEKGVAEGFRLGEISSGSKEILALITKIVLSRGETNLLLIEEPELHLHPGAEEEVYDLIEEVTSEGPQVLVTTHSDVFVNRSDASNIVRVERTDINTTFRHISDGEIATELSDLGYEKSSLLQSEAVVFVEGKSDERVLKQFAQTCGLNFDRSGIKLVELDGEGNIRSDGRSLVKLLSAFDIPYLFVVDSHGNSRKVVRDEILQDINSRKGDWHITPDHIHVWDSYGIEDFLIELPNAIQSVVGGDVTEIQTTIQNYDGEEKAEVLNDIFQTELGEPYDKNQHGMLIAKQAEEEAIPDEVKEVIEKIRHLPE